MSIKRALLIGFTVAFILIIATWFIGHLWVFIMLVTSAFVGIALNTINESKNKCKGKETGGEPKDKQI